MQSGVRTVVLAAVLGICAGAVAGRSVFAGETEEKPETGPALDSLEQKASYALGVRVGKDLRRSGAGFDVAAFVRGFDDAMNARKEVLSADEQEKAQEALMEKVQRLLPEKNQKAADAFLAGNRQKKGIKETESGLQYEMLKEGDGKSPQATDTVKVHYCGTIEDGTEFDSSYRRGQPVSFALNRVIPGWTEGVQLMKVGGKIKLYLPPKLGYGERGTGREGPIGPNQLLIFEIELLGVE
jgi:FKBP-type peptidyl-prolyl cis-trans isomerase FkpA/FKBP-type peptidyl-prolyl cis-trans isomerase FklB